MDYPLQSCNVMEEKEEIPSWIKEIKAPMPVELREEADLLLHDEHLDLHVNLE